MCRGLRISCKRLRTGVRCADNRATQPCASSHAHDPRDPLGHHVRLSATRQDHQFGLVPAPYAARIVWAETLVRAFLRTGPGLLDRPRAICPQRQLKRLTSAFRTGLRPLAEV